MADVIPITCPKWAVVADFGPHRLFLARNPHREPGVNGTGWKRWVWTRDAAAALVFFERGDAEQFANEWMADGWRAAPIEEVAAVAA